MPHRSVQCDVAFAGLTAQGVMEKQNLHLKSFEFEIDGISRPWLS